MYPPSFDYFAPTSLGEALELLARHGEDAKVLAGGQSLIPLMKLRFAAPRVLVDVNRIPHLDGLVESDGGLRIGALVRHRACERSALLRGRYGTLGAAAPQVSDPLVRNLGTVAGSLAHADPQGDWGSVLLAVRGEVVARSSSGERTIAVDELFARPFTTTLRADELIADVRVPTRVLEPAAPTRSWSARSATSPPQESRSSSCPTTAGSDGPVSRSPASTRRTCARPPPSRL